MKKIKPFLLTVVLTLFVAGCDNSLERASNTIGLMQDQVTKIVNELYEVQNLENNLQSDFEEDLANANDNLEYFNQDEILVMQNISQRKTHLNNMKDAMKELNSLVPELESAKKNQNLPTGDFDKLATMITNLQTDLTTYTDNYLPNLDLEAQTFQSIGNPNVNYNSFFKVFDNINTLSQDNLYYLDAVLKHFEPLNGLLVDTKVKIVTLKEAK
uniref:YkyA family protein n=1 Tax=Globicatella sulfidifaciens TaxID=136093 RepID=UPI0023EFFE6D|nr:YkyA family protein [Globicatella sulfidifaciens]